VPSYGFPLFHSNDSPCKKTITGIFFSDVTANTQIFLSFLYFEIEKLLNHYRVYLPCTGAKIFKYKQSSDWFWRKGKSLFKYSSLPFGIFSNAAESFRIFGNRCGHTGLYLSDILIPSQGDGVRVGLNL